MGRGEDHMRVTSNEQSINADVVQSIAMLRQSPISLKLNAIDWQWLGTSIDHLIANDWLIGGSDRDLAVSQLLNASASLFNFALEVGMKAAIAYDLKSAGSNGGTFTSGAWRQRDLNTEIDPNNIINVASNAVTISEAGLYYIRAIAPAQGVGGHVCRLTKNNAELQVGTQCYTGGTSQGQGESVAITVAQLVVGDIIRLENQCKTTYATYGFGVGDVNTVSSVVAIFSIIEFIRLGD